MAQAFAPLRRLAGLLRGRPDGDYEPSPAAAGEEPTPALTEAVVRSSQVRADPPAVMVDAATRTFWQRGAPNSETLVEARGAAPGESVGRKVAVLAAEQPAMTGPARRAPGPGDPAFVEVSLVEMLRAGHFDRAFALLAPDCRSAWGSVETFASENASAARQLLGAEVQASRRMPCWEDADGRLHRGVAELEVEYALAGAERITTLRRTVHLVRAEGGWRSLLYPASPAASAA